MNVSFLKDGTPIVETKPLGRTGRAELLERVEQMGVDLEALLDRLRGRMDASLRTAQLHPELAVRHEASVRALAYENALGDVLACLKPELMPGWTCPLKECGVFNGEA